ncbi:MAG: caspase family protein [Rhodocyclaceae bacterium]|nr:caspase family protein [Rhodocyclaceae bacterium]
MNRKLILAITALGLVADAVAQMPMRPPAFIGGIPGMTQMQSIFTQRHQTRTALYREALEELRKNPQAADVPECPPGGAPHGTLCLNTAPTPAVTPTPVAVAEIKPQSAAPLPPPQPLPTPAVAADPVAPTTAPTPAEAKLPAKPGAAPVPENPLPLPPAPKVAVPTTVVASAPVDTAPPPAPIVSPRRIAVLVGNNAYSTPIPALETPIADVESIAQVLQNRFGFESRVVRNAGKAQIIAAINEIAASTRPEDSIVLLYAGHGYLMDDTRMGFWIPVDASVKTPANWISNTDISKLLKAIPARQLILVSDSCFSGSLTKEQKVSSGKADRDEILRRRSVVVFSSGDEEPVSDEGKEGHSIFAYNLIKALESASGVTPGYEIYQVVHGKVRKEYEQTPQYGAVVSAGHVSGGEYLFETAGR